MIGFYVIQYRSLTGGRRDRQTVRQNYGIVRSFAYGRTIKVYNNSGVTTHLHCVAFHVQESGRPSQTDLTGWTFIV